MSVISMQTCPRGVIVFILIWLNSMLPETMRLNKSSINKYSELSMLLNIAGTAWFEKISIFFHYSCLTPLLMLLLHMLLSVKGELESWIKNRERERERRGRKRAAGFVWVNITEAATKRRRQTLMRREPQITRREAQAKAAL